MQVLIVRHGVAEDQQRFIASSGQSDEQRPLTEEGISKMREAAKGLRILLPNIEKITASPLVRAQQTADILVKAYATTQETLAALAPAGDQNDILSYLRQHHKWQDATLALVGHEPNLGQLASWLLTGQAGRWTPLKKGAACLLNFADDIEAGHAKLVWSLPNKVLRHVAE